MPEPLTHESIKTVLRARSLCQKMDIASWLAQCLYFGYLVAFMILLKKAKPVITTTLT